MPRFVRVCFLTTARRIPLTKCTQEQSLSPAPMEGPATECGAPSGTGRSGRGPTHRRFPAQNSELPPILRVVVPFGHHSLLIRRPRAAWRASGPLICHKYSRSATVPPASAAHLLLAVSRTPYRRGLRVAQWRSPMRPRRGLCPSSSRLL